MIKTSGTGWIKNGRCGLKRKGQIYKYSDLKSLYSLLKDKGLFVFPVENFSRFDQMSKLTCLAIALTLYDARVIYAKGKKLDIGVLFSGRNGSFDAQSAYFKDYVDNGRLLGRGNLFIYTLPSSPMAEASIHFGLKGPLLYMDFSGSQKDIKLIEYAKRMIAAGQAKMVLVLQSNNRDTICSAIGAL
jgi:hypothetical protein